MVSSAVLSAVRRVTGEAREQATMLYACGAESGCRSIQNAQGGNAYGPWQILTGQGLSVADAMNPTTAAAWLYANEGVASCTAGQGGAWDSDPYGAAKKAAECTEKGGVYTNASQIAAGRLAMGAVIPSLKSGPTKIGNPITTIKNTFCANNPLNPFCVLSGVGTVAGGVSGTASKLSAIFAFLSAPDFWERALMMIGGIGITLIGVEKLLSGGVTPVPIPV